MLVEILNKKSGKSLARMDAEFGTGSVSVTKILYLDRDFPLTEHLLKDDTETAKMRLGAYLMERCPYICSLEYDNYALKVLDLEKERPYFGRMCDHRVAVSLLNHFELPEDELAVYPVSMEIVSFSGYDPAFCNKYLLKPYNGDFTQ